MSYADLGPPGAAARVLVTLVVAREQRPGGQEHLDADRKFREGEASKSREGAASVRQACSASHVYDNNQLNGYLITVTVANAYGLSSSQSGIRIVNNVAPVATLAVPTGVNDGQTFTIALVNPVDPSIYGSANLTYFFDCGDGSGYFQPAGATSAICAAPDNGSTSLTVKGKLSLGSTVTDVAADLPWTTYSWSVTGGLYTVNAATGYDSNNFKFTPDDNGTYLVSSGMPSTAAPARSARSRRTAPPPALRWSLEISRAGDDLRQRHRGRQLPGAVAGSAPSRRHRADGLAGRRGRLHQ